jgi:hypothetical protein
VEAWPEDNTPSDERKSKENLKDKDWEPVKAKGKEWEMP